MECARRGPSTTLVWCDRLREAKLHCAPVDLAVAERQLAEAEVVAGHIRLPHELAQRHVGVVHGQEGGAHLAVDAVAAQVERDQPRVGLEPGGKRDKAWPGELVVSQVEVEDGRVVCERLRQRLQARVIEHAGREVERSQPRVCLQRIAKVVRHLNRLALPDIRATKVHLLRALVILLNVLEDAHNCGFLGVHE